MRGADGVADALWERVRDLSERADELLRAEAEGRLDRNGEAHLDRIRIRLARAAQRAELADQLGDQLAAIDRARARRLGARPPRGRRTS